MNLKYKIIVSAVALGAAFSFGRFSAPPPLTLHSIKQDDLTVTKDKDTHKVTTIQKDGTKETTTIIEDTVTRSDLNRDSVTKVDSSIRARKTINLSALAGIDYHDVFKPIYGLSVNKEFLGPITLGAYGMTNGLIGISIGMNF